MNKAHNLISALTTSVLLNGCANKEIHHHLARTYKVSNKTVDLLTSAIFRHIHAKEIHHDSILNDIKDEFMPVYDAKKELKELGERS